MRDSVRERVREVMKGVEKKKIISPFFVRNIYFRGSAETKPQILNADCEYFVQAHFTPIAHNTELSRKR